MKISTTDYLFIKYKVLVIPLTEIVNDYYPHLSKAKMMERARQQEFPFTCFRLDSSQKAPYFVHLNELAKLFDEQYLDASKLKSLSI